MRFPLYTYGETVPNPRSQPRDTKQPSHQDTPKGGDTDAVTADGGQIVLIGDGERTSRPPTRTTLRVAAR